MIGDGTIDTQGVEPFHLLWFINFPPNVYFLSSGAGLLDKVSRDDGVLHTEEIHICREHIHTRWHLGEDIAHFYGGIHLPDLIDADGVFRIDL